MLSLVFTVYLLYFILSIAFGVTNICSETKLKEFKEKVQYRRIQHGAECVALPL